MVLNSSTSIKIQVDAKGFKTTATIDSAQNVEMAMSVLDSTKYLLQIRVNDPKEKIGKFIVSDPKGNNEMLKNDSISVENKVEMTRFVTGSKERLGRPQQKKLIVILGATGSGKSRLSVDLATRLSSCEIINSDKMQLYKGLPIATNKMPMHERLGVPHHLIDEFDSTDDHELTPKEFRSLATCIVGEISSRNHIPMLVGGSNSFVYAFLTKELDSSIFELDYDLISSELRYNCCFLWIYVSLPVLKRYVFKRVDEMLEAGMLKELAEFYESIGGSLDSTAPQVCIKRSIGVPEFTLFFQFKTNGADIDADYATKKKLLKEAVQEMKDNTYELAKKQIEKIEILRLAGWNIHKLDATEVIRMKLKSDSSKSSEIWENEVMKPSMNIVKQFLFEE